MATNPYCMYKISFVFSFLLFFSECWAQKSLLFYNVKTNDSIEMKVGHRATILYKGYLGQLEVVKETVTDITDSTIVLGVNLAENFPSFVSKPGKSNRFIYKTIKITDIVGFRRMTVGRQVAKLMLSIATVVGSVYIAQKAYSGNFNALSAFGVTLGAGLGLFWLNNVMLPESIKYYFEEGWSVIVITKMQPTEK